LEKECDNPIHGYADRGPGSHLISHADRAQPMMVASLVYW